MHDKNWSYVDCNFAPIKNNFRLQKNWCALKVTAYNQFFPLLHKYLHTITKIISASISDHSKGNVELRSIFFVKTIYNAPISLEIWEWLFRSSDVALFATLLLCWRSSSDLFFVSERLLSKAWILLINETTSGISGLKSFKKVKRKIRFLMIANCMRQISSEILNDSNAQSVYLCRNSVSNRWETNSRSLLTRLHSISRAVQASFMINNSKL